MKTTWKAVAAATVVAFGLVACGSSTAGNSSASPSPKANSPVTDSPAADLRTHLTGLLGEHMFIAAKATDAAVNGNTQEFQAYGTLLNTNGTDLGAMIGAAYGDAAKDKFNGLWSTHNGLFVDYTTAAAKHDQAGMAAAVDGLKTKYIAPFATFLAGATGLPEATLTQLLTTHVTGTATVVDDEVAKNYAKMYTDLRMAYAHMYTLGNPLSEAIVTKVHDKFSGDAANKGVDFRVSLNQLLQEHLYLATMATDAALQGHTEEFKAAGDALNANGNDIGAALGGIYGPAAKDKFNQIWSEHDGFFVDYTVGLGTKDQAKSAGAVKNLTEVYVPKFSDFISGATGLPKDAVSQLTTTHVLTTKGVVDDQSAGSWAKATTDDRLAAQHMSKLGDPLAKAIVDKVPDKFQA